MKFVAAEAPRAGHVKDYGVHELLSGAAAPLADVPCWSADRGKGRWYASRARLMVRMAPWRRGDETGLARRFCWSRMAIWKISAAATSLVGGGGWALSF